MAKRMLIDATHAEETRVVVVSGTRLEEFDVETSTKKQLKGNIYLAKVVRVEPSLQAAFVDYGGGRHGFLAFNEIHPDYFQIPVADRQALLAEQHDVMRQSSVAADFDDGDEDETAAPAIEPMVIESAGGASGRSNGNGEEAHDADDDHHTAEDNSDFQAANHEHELDSVEGPEETEEFDEAQQGEPLTEADLALAEAEAEAHAMNEAATYAQADDDHSHAAEAEGAPASEQERPRRRSLRSYKIQEVIKRRQILLVQVVKEERGNKGAALTTYLSLAGRYCVLMPNTARGGGVSRKITNVSDRKRLKTIVNELDIPPGMAVIVRTAGSERTKPEIKRDYEYLLRLWDSVRTLTLQSTAPALVYEEANLIKRSIRDLYSRDIDEVHVEGEDGYRLAKDFMRMLTPSHARKVQLYRDPVMPLFHKYQVEAQLDAMHSPVVQLRSGGYLVINQAEALVAIDVNSGRSTKERHIEETALKTNLEAADEVARQLRLRDLAGLIVIDFIDMEETRNNNLVERRLKEAMRFDRARIQLGRISPFGLLELSRQRLRPSLMESSFLPCPHCDGTGMIRSVESASMHVLRAIEEEGVRRRSSEVTVTVHADIALYILNQKRAELSHIEGRYGFRVYLMSDNSLVPPALRMDRVKSEVPIEIPAALPMPIEEDPQDLIDEELADEAEDSAEETRSGQGRAAEKRTGEDRTSQGRPGEGKAASDPAGDDSEEGRRRRRRRRRRGRRDEQDAQGFDQDGAPQTEAEEGEDVSEAANGAEEAVEAAPEGDDSNGEMMEASPRRRRGKRGGRRRQRRGSADLPPIGEGEEGQDTLPGESAEAPAEALTAEAPLETKAAIAAESVTAETSPVAPTETTTEEPAKPKRARSRKKAEEPAVDAEKPAAAEALPVTEQAAETDAKPKRSRTKKKAVEAETVAEEPATALAETPAAPEAVSDEPAQPARKGWWNRFL